jgi:hypothetical protein
MTSTIRSMRTNLTWRGLFAQIVVLVVLAVCNVISDSTTWTLMGVNGYVSLALPFVGYMMEVLVAGLVEKVSG